MKIITLSSLLLLTQFSYSQLLSLNISYLSDIHLGNDWFNENGATLGVGIDGVSFENLPLTYSVSYKGQFSGSKKNVPLDNVLFDSSDSLAFGYGFARADFKKFGFSMDYDIGYQYDEYQVIEPYISIGPRVEGYSSNAYYELYPTDSCNCTNATTESLTSTTSIGYKTGIGFKIRIIKTFSIDFRASYYGGWSLNNEKSTNIPNAESFNINYTGTPGFTMSNKRYNDGFNFSVGIIFSLSGSGGYGGYSSYDDDDDSDDDWMSSDDSNESSSGSSSSGCESGGLSTSGRGNGGGGGEN